MAYTRFSGCNARPRNSTWYEANDLLSNPSNHDADGKEFSDWRLPTKRELNLMYVVYNNGNAAILNRISTGVLRRSVPMTRGPRISAVVVRATAIRTAHQCACCSGFLVI